MRIPTSLKFIPATVIFLCLFTPTSLPAQKSNSGDYLILHQGDTLYGKVEYINESSTIRDFHKKIQITDASGKRKKYKREAVAAFRVDNTDYESFWLKPTSQKIFSLNVRYDLEVKKGDLYFLKVRKRGNLSHYELEWFEQGESFLMSMDLLKKEEDDYLLRATQGLLGIKRKALRDYFAECPDLQMQIDQKQQNEIGSIVEFYNNNCPD